VRFDVYGRFRIEVRRERDRWAVYRLGEGTRRPDPDLAIDPGAPRPGFRRRWRTCCTSTPGRGGGCGGWTSGRATSGPATSVGRHAA
jgi:hypothetical protein